MSEKGRWTRIICFKGVFCVLWRRLTISACFLCLATKVVSHSLWPHRLWPIRLLCPCDFPGNKTGVGCHYLLQGILPSQGLNLCLLHWLTDSSPLSPSFSILFHIPHILNHCLNVVILTLSPSVLSSSGCSGLPLPDSVCQCFPVPFRIQFP